MNIKSENIEFRDKIMKGVNKALKKLVIASAEKDEKLVIADADGNVQHIPARELLKQLQEGAEIESRP